jgi:hypothetical protein
MNQLNLKGEQANCIVQNLDEDGNVIGDADEVTVKKGFKYTHVVNNWREDKKLPFFDTSGINGFANTKVEHVTQGSDSLGGSFTVTVNDEALVVDWDESDADLKTKIQSLAVITED